MKECIFVIATKNKIEFDRDLSFSYTPMITGANTVEKVSGYIGDNIGQNISDKNANYCELTALYSAWKNFTDYSFIGFNHYRRYFLLENNFGHSFYLNPKTNIAINGLLLDESKAKLILKKKDIILVKPFTYYHSIESVLARIVSNDDITILENLFRVDYPDYFDEYISFMRFNNKISSCNMFVTSKKHFELYSEWLFEVLFKYEKLVKISPYESSARIFGFISEALLNIYVRKNKLNVEYKSILVLRDNITNDNPLIYYLKNLRSEFSFFFNKSKRVKY